MQLGVIIAYLYPNLSSGTDYAVISEEEGQRLEWYSNDVPEPTQAELAAAELPAMKAFRRRQMESRFDQETRADFPSAFLLMAIQKLNASEDKPRLDRLDDRIKKLKQVYKSIDDAPTVAAVQAITWN